MKKLTLEELLTITSETFILYNLDTKTYLSVDAAYRERLDDGPYAKFFVYDIEAEEIPCSSGYSQLCIHISEKEINNEKSSI